ncbi:MAG: DedA family protein [Betaproteobacteria bacterium]|nr:DedA family protein [Betaproteobacteria bacterium]
MFFGLDPLVLLHNYGYLTILIWTFLEGETVVIIAGVLAQQGYMDPKFIALCAFCGSCTSDQLMFLLGKCKGAAVLSRFPKLARNADRAEHLIRRYETPLILGFRFVYGVRNVTPIMLGINKVNHLKFLILNVIGAGTWALTFTWGGFFFGKLFEEFMQKASHVAFYILAVAAVLASLIWYIRQRRRSQELMRIIEENNARGRASQNSGSMEHKDH